MIREATIADLPAIAPGAHEFYSKSEFLQDLDMACFIKTWETILRGKWGVIFLLIHDGLIVGFIGGVQTSDPNNGHLVASEAFWFVQESARGSGGSLYRAFERWARKSGCRQIQMVHLADSMPERLARFYGKLGFRKAEVRYVKELTCPSASL